MKIHFTIEFDEEMSPRIARKIKKNLEQSDVIDSALPTNFQGGKMAVKMVKIADVAPEPIPAEAAPAPKSPTLKPNSGPQFDPGFLKIVLDANEPFTRVMIAVATGLSKEDVTQRLNRLKHKGWIENPAPGLWRRKTRTTRK